MSRQNTGNPDYPVLASNGTGDVLPGFSIFALTSGTYVGNTLQLTATKPSGNVESLFVNGGSQATQGKAIRCRSIYDGPFWVKYDPDNAPGEGDIVGPVENELFVSTDGQGLYVIYKDDNLGVVLCTAVSDQQINKAEMIEDLQSGDVAGKRAWLLEWSDGSSSWTRTSTEIDVYGDEGFRGMAFGRTDAVDAGDKVDVYKDPRSGRWYAITGGTFLHGTATEDVPENSSGVPTTIAVVAGAGSDERDIEISTFHWFSETKEGDSVFVWWNSFSRHWDSMRGGSGVPEWGCGLLEVTENDVTYVKVDNTVLAGTGLAPQGTCSLSLSDQVQALLAQLASLLGGLADNGIAPGEVGGAITDLRRCCEDNAAAIYECCAHLPTVDVVYSVTCVNGQIKVQDKCIYVRPCT